MSRLRAYAFVVVALHFSAANALEAQDPAKSPEIVRLSEETAACISASYIKKTKSKTSGDANYAKVNTQNLNAAIRDCSAQTRFLATRYDEIFGVGLGKPFLNKSFSIYLERYIMERLYEQPEKRRETVKLQKSGNYISGGETDKCPYKGLLALDIQKETNKNISKVKLREDLIGKRFAVTTVEFDLWLDDKEGVSYSLNDTEIIGYCFPFFKTHIRSLEREYIAKTKSLPR